MSPYRSVLIHHNSVIMFFGCLYPCSLHWTSSVHDTGSSRLGPDKGGKCDSVGLSVACPSKLATIHSVVEAVAWAKANQFREWLRALSCILQHESLWVKGNPKGLGSGRDREEMEDRDMGSILVDYQTEGLETRVWLLILQVERETYRERLGIRDRMYREERSM